MIKISYLIKHLNARKKNKTKMKIYINLQIHTFTGSTAPLIVGDEQTGQTILLLSIFLSVVENEEESKLDYHRVIKKQSSLKQATYQRFVL